MSFILQDTAREDNSLQLNAWHWKTILVMLEVAEVLPTEKLHLMGVSGACPTVSEEEVRSIATGLREKVIPLFAVDDRIFIDGTVTKEPDDGTFHRGETEWHLNYSTNGAVLRELCSFCESCGPLVIC